MASPTPTHPFLMESRRIQISHKNPGLVNVNHYTAHSLQISPQSLSRINFIRTITNRRPEILIFDEGLRHSQMGLCRRSPEHPGLSGEGSAMDQGMHLHSSVLYKLMGELNGFFPGERGLRQGDLCRHTSLFWLWKHFLGCCPIWLWQTKGEREIQIPLAVSERENHAYMFCG